MYFACSIFVGKGHRRKIFNGENFVIYGMDPQLRPLSLTDKFYHFTHQDIFESVPPGAAEEVEGCSEVRVGHLGLDTSAGLVPKPLLLGSVAAQSQSYQVQNSTW